VELPLASDSPPELAGLALELMAALPAAATAGACIVAASEQVAAAVQATRSSSSSGRQGGGPVLSLRAACQADSLSGPLLLLAPASSDVSFAAVEFECGKDHGLHAAEQCTGCAHTRQHVLCWRVQLFSPALLQPLQTLALHSSPNQQYLAVVLMPCAAAWL
jgi:hypothetical protein